MFFIFSKSTLTLLSHSKKQNLKRVKRVLAIQTSKWMMSVMQLRGARRQLHETRWGRVECDSFQFQNGGQSDIRFSGERWFQTHGCFDYDSNLLLFFCVAHACCLYSFSLLLVVIWWLGLMLLLERVWNKLRLWRL